MKYIKTFCTLKNGWYPNTTDRQYWIFFEDGEADDNKDIIRLLKFIEFDGSEYRFESINAITYKYNDKIYYEGQKDDNVELYKSGLTKLQKDHSLRLATEDEKQQYEYYSNIIKYNL